MPRGRRTSDETRAKVIELKLGNLDLSSHQIEDMLKGTEWQVSKLSRERIRKRKYY